MESVEFTFLSTSAAEETFDVVHVAYIVLQVLASTAMVQLIGERVREPEGEGEGFAAHFVPSHVLPEAQEAVPVLVSSVAPLCTAVNLLEPPDP